MKTYLPIFICSILLLTAPSGGNVSRTAHAETAEVLQKTELSCVEGMEVSFLIEVPLTEMLAAVRAEGLPVYLASGYRDEELTEFVSRRCAALGISFENTDHPTGLAVDLTDLYCEKRDDAAADSPTLKWLYIHSREFGFTPCPEVSPWHFLYTGAAPTVAEAEKPWYNKSERRFQTAVRSQVR